VLTAAGIPHWLQSTESGVTVLVADTDADKAREALDAYDEETRSIPIPAVTAAVATDTAWIIGFALGAALLGFFAVTGPAASDSRWFEHGAAAAGLMLHGEPWRAATALTLHVDMMHVVSNAIAMALLVPPVVQGFGVGGGLCLMLAGGAIANLIAAALQAPEHVAVGASTATFAAIGILSAIQLSATGRASRKWWIVPAAALLLLTMLGTSRTADALAHAVGLVTGGVLGFAVAVVRRPLAEPLQWALVVVTALVIVACWHFALSSDKPHGA